MPATPEQESLERRITAPGQLLVEGRVPQMFVREMIAAIGVQTSVEVRTFGDISKNNLQTYLEIFTQKVAFKEQVKRLGIIRDAEKSDANGAFQSVQAALRGAKQPVPDRINELGGSPVGVGVFILPNCQDAGMLEDLCLTAIAEKEHGQPTAVLPCVEDFFGCLKRNGRNPVNAVKARFAGYALASDVIDPQLGRAAQKGAIPWEANAFNPLKAFIRAVAGQT